MLFDIKLYKIYLSENMENPKIAFNLDLNLLGIVIKVILLQLQKA